VRVVKAISGFQSRESYRQRPGLKNISIAPLHRVEDGINAVRVFLPKCWFDANKCARGIDALKLYRAAYDDKLQALQTGFYRRIEYSQLGVV
jgi:phage terminase large subunit